MVDHDHRLFVGQVVRAALLTPVMRRVVLAGPGLVEFDTSGHPDEWVQLFIPPDAVGRPGPDPLNRWYTVRRWDPAVHELTLDIVVHDQGAATQWAEQARPGDEITVSAPAGRFDPGIDRGWVLVVADQTALPAASRILEELASGAEAYAILEAPDPDSLLPISSAAELDVSWVFHSRPARSASPLVSATRSFAAPGGQGYIWMAGEASAARDIRKYVRHQLGWKPAHYDIVGYWRPQGERLSATPPRDRGRAGGAWDAGGRRAEMRPLSDEVISGPSAAGS